MTAALEEDTQVQGATSTEVRRAALADHDALVEMYLTFEPKGASLGLPPRKEPQNWLDYVARYPNFVVCVNGRIAGHGVLCPEDSSAEVAVFIHQDYRRRGLGKRLLGELINEARRLACAGFGESQSTITFPCCGWRIRSDSFTAATLASSTWTWTKSGPRAITRFSPHSPASKSTFVVPCLGGKASLVGLPRTGRQYQKRNARIRSPAKTAACAISLQPRRRIGNRRPSWNAKRLARTIPGVKAKSTARGSRC